MLEGRCRVAGLPRGQLLVQVSDVGRLTTHLAGLGVGLPWSRKEGVGV